MNIVVNGEVKNVAAEFTLQQLIEQLNLGGKRLAIEVNLEIVPRSHYAEHALNDGDRIEIVHAIGGG